jgi:hypothetical protein
MKSLYRHLDVCQKLGITVVLTDWGCAKQSWMKAPGLAGTADPAYAQAVGTYLDYLLNQRGYSCIRYFVLTNEPNYFSEGWSAWKKGVQNVAAVLKKRHLDEQVVLVGADESNDEGWHRRAVEQLSRILGAYDVHCYANDWVLRPGRLEDFFRRHWQHALAKDPEAAAKPFIVGEAGMHDGAVHPRGNRNIAKFEYGLLMADYAVQAARAGSWAVIAWMMDDSSHEGFFWGLWPGKQGRFKPRPWFYPWSLLCRCFPAGATILRPRQLDPQLRVLAGRVKNAQAEDWSFCLVNRGPEAVHVSLLVPNGPRLSLKRYLYSRPSARADRDGFPVPVVTTPADLGKGTGLTCPANSVVFLTSLK